MFTIYLLQAKSTGGFGGFQFIFLGLMIVVFWMFFIRPQAKRAKTQKKFIEDLGIKVIAVEELTGYPSILGGRVKTLHPKIFGGILNRRELAEDQKHVLEYEIKKTEFY